MAGRDLKRIRQGRINSSPAAFFKATAIFKAAAVFLFLVHLNLAQFNSTALAFTTARTRIPVDGKLWKTWFDKGIRAMDKGNFKRALSSFETALMLEPASGEILNNIGVVHYRQKDYSKAEGYFLRAISKNKKLVDSYVNLGLVYYEEKRWSQLKDHAETFLRIFPGSGIAYFGLGVSSYYMEEYQKAEEYLEKSLNDMEASHEYAQEAKKLIIKSRAKEKREG